MSSIANVAVVGAGAAGLAAAKTLQERGISFILLEAAQRTGGRAFTEHFADGAPFDLGCHWLHSASLNPFVKIADRFGIRYEMREGYGAQQLFRNGAWLPDSEFHSFDKVLAINENIMRTAWAEKRDISVFDAMKRDIPWTSLVDYMTSLDTSSDPDQVSIGDIIQYQDTNENWPVVDGYGELVTRWAADVPVELNTMVQEIHWGGQAVRLLTTRGDVHAEQVIVTVSTGILGSGVIRFVPELPERKQAAIAALPLGNYNRIRLSIEPGVFANDVPERVVVMSDDELPMSLSIRPYGFDCVVGIVGGRYADWLERAGPATSVAAVRDQLCTVFGNEIAKKITGDRQSAWRGDPLVKGAYSSALPGEFHQRGRLSEPLDEKLFFAGEAASTDHFCTCHGALMTGNRAATEIADAFDAAMS